MTLGTAQHTPPLVRRVLFVTRMFPYPAHTGAHVYSDQILRAAAELADDVIVVCADGARGNGLPKDLPGNIRFRTFTPRPISAPARVLALSPNAALPGRCAAAEAALRDGLAAVPDIVLVDHVGASWALPHLPPQLPLVYCTHNDEYLTRRSIARQAGMLAGYFHRFDALRVHWRDRTMMGRAALVTAITRKDEMTQRARYRPTAITVLPPRWQGAVPIPLDLAAAPRRVLLLGSLLWSAKKQNLRAFLDATNERFKAAGIGITVAGRVDPETLAQLRRRYPDVCFLGEIEAERETLEGARIGILFGEAGGGFRLTGLNYGFHGLPIAARPELVRDLELPPAAFVGLGSDAEAPDAIAAAIDDLPRLVSLRDAARQTLSRLSDGGPGRDLRWHLEKALPHLPRRGSKKGHAA